MAGNPIEEFLEVKKEAADSRKQRDLDMLHTWRSNGKQPEHLEPLLKAFDPIVGQKLRQWKAPAVPEAAMKGELQKHLIKAFETYDPNRGAALNTHVENYLQKAKRFNRKNQNFAQFSEEIAGQIGPIQKAHDELHEQFGRTPTHEEIAELSGISPRLVARTMKSLRRDIRASTFENDPTEMALQRDHEVLELLPYSLNQEENQVFNHIYGQNGAKKISGTNDIAKALGKSPSQVSRLRTSILNKFTSNR